MSASQQSSAEALPFRFRLWTRWSDDDAQGVLNHAVHFTLCEEARLRWCRLLGRPERPEGFGFVLASTTARFLAPGRGGEEVDVHLGTTRLSRSSFQQRYRIHAVGDGATWAELEAVMVCWDARLRASTPMPASFRAAILAQEPGLAAAP